jgi:hypothetical protein
LLLRPEQLVSGLLISIEYRMSGPDSIRVRAGASVSASGPAHSMGEIVVREDRPIDAEFQQGLVLVQLDVDGSAVSHCVGSSMPSASTNVSLR